MCKQQTVLLSDYQCCHYYETQRWTRSQNKSSLQCNELANVLYTRDCVSNCYEYTLYSNKCDSIILISQLIYKYPIPVSLGQISAVHFLHLHLTEFLIVPLTVLVLPGHN